MPRKTAITALERAEHVPGAVTVTQDGEVSGFPITPGEVAEADVRRVIAELGDNTNESKVQIWKIIKGERYPAYVKTYAPDMFSMERLADDCGGGTYDVTVYVPSIGVDAEGKEKRLGLKIAAKPRVFVHGPDKEIKRPDPPSTTAPPAQSQPSDIAQLAGAMLSGFEKMSTAIAASKETRQSNIEMLKELMAIKALFAQDQPRAVDEFERFEKFLSMQDTMRSALDKLPGNANNSQMLLALGRDFLSMFKKAGNTQAPAALSAPDAAIVADPAAPVPDAAPVQEPQGEDGMNLIFKGYVSILVTNARANNDVSKLAQTIYDQAPEDFLEAIFRDDKWLDRLAEYNKDVKLYPLWFERLRVRIKEIHDADQASE
jgi:hypothetical protein